MQPWKNPAKNFVQEFPITYPPLLPKHEGTNENSKPKNRTKFHT
jgi:hypothetical protein